MISLEFLITSLVVVLIPGKSVIYIRQRWLRHGFAGTFAGLGAKLAVSER